MEIVYITAGSIFFLGFGIFSFFYIKAKYKEFETNELLKEQIVKMRVNIKESQDYFRTNYNSDVYKMIKANIDLCLELILNKKLKYQLTYLEQLYKTLYETGYRLKTNYDDPIYIITPLKNFRAKLGEELIDYIKDALGGQ